MPLKDILQILPKWLITAVVIALLLVFLERIYIAERPFEIAGFSFGPKPCAEAPSSQSILPIGTIVSSILRPSEFAKAVGDFGNFDPRTTKWMPADKRDVSGSEYAKSLEKTTLPDLRGVFLRGLNTFEPGNPRKDDLRDPDGDRIAGEPQKDDLKEHLHTVNVAGDRSPFGNANGEIYQSAADSRYRASKSNTTTEDGGDETRPKNIAVYFYIKINP